VPRRSPGTSPRHPGPAGLRPGICRALNEEGMNLADRPRDLLKGLQHPGSDER
jgi:hypothetical protein